MINKVITWVALLAIIASAGSVLTMVAPEVANAASTSSCSSSFLGFPAWYRGLTYDDGKGNPCAIKSPTGGDGLSNFIWHIALNVVEIALVAVAYISAIFTLYGGFLFITSQGKPENATKARMTMLDAVIGLLISFVAIVAVDFIIKGLSK
jgi:hypothetical protein